MKAKIRKKPKKELAWLFLIKKIIGWFKEKNKERAARVKKAIARDKKKEKQKSVPTKTETWIPKPTLIYLTGFLTGFLFLSAIIFLAVVAILVLM